MFQDRKKPKLVRHGLKRGFMLSAWAADRSYELIKKPIFHRLGLDIPNHIQPYRGYANKSQAWIMGRVLANDPPPEAREDDTWRENLTSAVKRWRTREVPNIQIVAELDGQQKSVQTNREGYFEFVFELEKPLDSTKLWHPVKLWVPASGRHGNEPLEATGFILAPPATSTFGVISDVDDTVLESYVTRTLLVLKMTFLKNARGRKPLEGVAELYQAFLRGPGGREDPQGNPIFYVSSSAWNLYDMLEDFLHLNDIPIGPILLQDLGIDKHRFIKSGHGHKLQKIHRLLAMYPDLPFVLVGDSGQKDAFLYLEAAKAYSDRIRAVYIRDVAPKIFDPRQEKVLELASECESLGIPMLLVKDSLQVAKHAHSLGLLHQEAIAPVRVDRDKDAAINEQPILASVGHEAST